MVSADSREAKALTELEESGAVHESKPGQFSSQAPELGPGNRLVRRLALLLVSSGGRLVKAGLPPHRPDGEGTDG